MNMAVCYNCPHFIDTDAEDYEVRDEVNFICEQCQEDAGDGRQIKHDNKEEAKQASNRHYSS